MHILAIPSWYPNSKNPYNGNFVQRHLEVLAEEHHVSVLNFISHEKKNIEIEVLTKGNLTEYQVFYQKKSAKFAQFLSLRKAFFQVVKQLNEVDLIHMHVILDKGFLGLWAKNYFKKDLFITEHASYLLRENYKQISTFQKLFLIQTIKRAKAISAVSELLKTEINYLFPHKKVFVTPNVVRTDLFQIAEQKIKIEKLKFIHISTLEKVKNVGEIIRAFEKLDSDFELTIIAENRNTEIETQIQNSNISNKINLLGPIVLEEVAEKLQNSDALILLSSFETFSCVVAEAWSCGIPVISTKVGIASNLDSSLGIQVEKATSESLVEALHQFLVSKDKFDPETIRKQAKAYSKEAVLESFTRFFSLTK